MIALVKLLNNHNHFNLVKKEKLLVQTLKSKIEMKEHLLIQKKVN